MSRVNIRPLFTGKTSTAQVRGGLCYIVESKADFLVIGQGVAGSLVTWELMRRGQRVRVLDEPRAGAASRSSGGLVNPLAGKKFPPAWRVQEALPYARDIYAALEDQLGCRLWFDQPMLRVLMDEKQVPALDRAAADPLASAFVGESFAPGRWAPQVADPLGSFVTQHAGWVDFETLVTRFRQWLAEQDLLMGEVEEPLEVAENVVYCEGWRGQENPHFSFVPWTPDRGLILHLELISGKLPPLIINRGQWLRPMWDGRYAAGATHGWDRFDQPPLEDEVMALLETIQEWTTARFNVVGATAGVRPAVNDRTPVLGRHPQDARRSILNGLGGKAALRAPFLARMLVNSLLAGEAIPETHDVARFWKG
ncbi:MAG: FAD dependent oxidoreductase [Puniceicoccaceae bacterium 5H]|nr:MAG: FAD dependent oxidoreductase [Puniceicoccaceae bacterium 5H]